MSLVGRLRKRKGRDKPSPKVEFLEVWDDPHIKGFADFGTVCGFDMTHCPYTIRGGKRVPVLCDQKRYKVLDDCERIERLIDPARRKDPSIPRSYSPSYVDAVNITLERAPLTKTGRQPRYPAVVTLDTMSPTIMPVDWDAYIDASAEAGRALDIPKSENHSLVATLSYLPSGKLGKADVYYWAEVVGHHFAIRMKDGKLRLDRVRRKRLKDEKWTVVYQ